MKTGNFEMQTKAMECIFRIKPREDGVAMTRFAKAVLRLEEQDNIEAKSRDRILEKFQHITCDDFERVRWLETALKSKCDLY
jgi:hypothetical protein